MNDIVKTYNILVVDDEQGNRESLNLILELMGHRAITACDGIEAMAALEYNKPDLLITDINMPRMDSLELLMAVKEQYPDIPVVVASGAKLDAKNSPLVKDMAGGVLQKPFGMDQVKVLIERSL